MEEKVRRDVQFLKGKDYSSCTKLLLPSIILPPYMVPFEKLWSLGFINCYLFDKTKGKTYFHKDGVMLLFNPSISLREENWDKFTEVMYMRPNLIEHIVYDYCLESFWFKINKKFLPNLRYYYIKGLYSHIKPTYWPFLNETEQKIVKMDENYRFGLEKSLNLEEGELEGCQLMSKPEEKDYVLDLTKILEE